MISQQDIADKLGLSRSLVSKVLNNKLGTTKVKPETQKAIFQCAEQVGYKPNPTAISLATGKQGAIGVVIRSFGTRGSMLPAMLTHGFTEEASHANQKLILTYFDDQSEFRCVDIITQSHQVDGIIFAGSVPMQATEQLADFDALPVVTVCTDFQNPRISRVTVDNQKIGRIATEHLIDRGCRQIANIHTWDYRTKGYRQALKNANLPVNDKLEYETVGFTHDIGAKAVRHFLDSNIPFDGLFAQSDEQAAGAINELLRLNIKVPGQVKVIGVDNAPFCEHSICPITSINQNISHAGRTALQLLTQLIADPSQKTQQITIEPFLVERQSTQ